MNNRRLINRYVIALLFFIISAVVIVLTTLKRTKAAHPEKFGIGRPARLEEIRRLDIDVRPDGKGLPVGSGNIASGQLIYNAKCIVCHGDGKKTESPLPGELLFLNHAAAKKKPSGDKGDRAPKTIGTYWPYATTIFDYVRRAMPYNAPGSLSNQEVYHLTAYLLYRNRIIPEHTVITEKTLPAVVMPAKEKYVEDDREGGTALK
jgi:hypothetical protein